MRANWPSSPLRPAVVVRIELGHVHDVRNRGRPLLLRLHHGLEHGSVGLEHLEAPLSGADGLEGDAARPTRRDPRGVGDVQLGHAGQLLEGDAHQRIGAVVLIPVGGDAEGQAAGRLEPAVGGAGPRPDDLEQVAEEAAHGVVGVARTEDAHPRML